jgi:hypothetical protein
MIGFRFPEHSYSLLMSGIAEWRGNGLRHIQPQPSHAAHGNAHSSADEPLTDRKRGACGALSEIADNPFQVVPAERSP